MRRRRKKKKKRRRKKRIHAGIQTMAAGASAPLTATLRRQLLAISCTQTNTKEWQ